MSKVVKPSNDKSAEERPTRVWRVSNVLAAAGVLLLPAAAVFIWSAARPHTSTPTRARLERVAEKKAVAAKPQATLPITTVNGTTTYEPESISISAAPAGYSAAISSSAVLSSFEAQVIPQNIIGSALKTTTPSVTLNVVTDSRTSPATQYSGWVVVYHNTAPQSYGPVQVSPTADCDFVGIYDLDTNQWSDFFQDCPS